ncbi:MAG: hypothetical protein GWP08_21500, partial [Nitrospiraceae bacterium]|nr:hypothetical protein [Nitrospiraceae bacterium]
RPWSGLTNHPAVIRAMRRSDEQSPVSFIISTGDIVENPGQGHGWQWRQFLRHITPFATTRPYLIGLGNHEARGGPERYEQYFDFGTVSSRNWYAFDYAGVHFVSLSTQDDTAPGSDQHTWLAEDLKAHAAESRFLVAFFHKPLRTYAPRESYRNPTVRENLLPLFEQYGVDIAFTGHVHAYEHHDLGALHHVVTGGGGVLLASTPVAGKETVQTETTHHFCRIDVTGDVLHMRAIRLDGSIIDEFTLHKRER